MLAKKKIFITGANGQLAKTLINKLSLNKYKIFAFSKKKLDISKYITLFKKIKKINPDILINCASYNNVDKAEKEKQKVYLTNCIGVKNISKICNKFDIPILHFSTDYVFYGNKKKAYKVEDRPRPKGIYGKSKLEGENIVRKFSKKYIIIRTSRLYSLFSNNFLDTIIKLAKRKKTLNLIKDQFSCPTSCDSLASVVIKILPIIIKKKINKIYHYANKDSCSWFEFAKNIIFFAKKKKIIKKKIILNPILTKDYNKISLRIRPQYSELDSNKICKDFKLKNFHWKKYLYQEINGFK